MDLNLCNYIPIGSILPNMDSMEFFMKQTLREETDLFL